MSGRSAVAGSFVSWWAESARGRSAPFPAELFDHPVTTALSLSASVLIGVVLVGFGGLTASRARDSRTRALAGAAAVILGLVVLAGVVLYNQSLHSTP